MTTDIEAFVALVREYRAVIDGADDRVPHALLLCCALLLPRIYAAGLALPDVEPETESVDARTIESPMRRLGAILGRYDSYLETFDPYEEGEQVHGRPLAGTLLKAPVPTFCSRGERLFATVREAKKA